MNNNQLVDELKAVFPLSDHLIRRGGGKLWFVYIDKKAIIDRLDRVFPMEWDSSIDKIRRNEDIVHGYGIDLQPCVLQRGTVTVTCRIKIRDFERTYDGSAIDNAINRWENKTKYLVGFDSENTQKAASTDSFKRCASMWGIGLYLQSAPKIEAGNRDQAVQIFAAWYREGLKNDDTSTPVIEDEEPEHPYPTSVNSYDGIPNTSTPPKDSNDGEWTSENKEEFLDKFSNRFPGSHHMPILGKMNVGSLVDLGSRVQAGQKLMEWCYEFCKPVLVEWMRYWKDSNGTYLEFTANQDRKQGHGIIRAYGRTSSFREMLNGTDNGLYKQLELSRYDAAAETTEWIKMPVGLVLKYHVGGSDKYPYNHCDGVELVF